MGSIINPTHHYFGCNFSLPLFSKITHFDHACAVTAWLESLLVQYHQLLVIFTTYNYTLVHTIMTERTGLQQEQTHAEVLDVFLQWTDEKLVILLRCMHEGGVHI